MVSFQCFCYTKPYFPLHKLQKYPSYKESVYKLWIFLEFFPQFCEFRDNQQNRVSLRKPSKLINGESWNIVPTGWEGP